MEAIAGAPWKATSQNACIYGTEYYELGDAITDILVKEGRGVGSRPAGGGPAHPCEPTSRLSACIREGGSYNHPRKG